MSKIKQLSKIELYTENCESIEIEAIHLGDILIRGIHTQIERYCSRFIVEKKFADYVMIEINKTADEDDYIFNRIMKYNDIAVITLYYDDGSEDEVRPVWQDGRNDGVNRFQDTYLTVPGHLIIVIDKDGTTVNDYCDKKYLDDPIRSAWHFKSFYEEGNDID